MENNKIILLDIDGTICQDIDNQDFILFPYALPIKGAKEIVNKWYDDGNIITLFTARESKDREVTLKWLDDNGFKYHGLIMDKPRCKDGWEYMWVDNRPVRGVTFKGVWTELVNINAKVQVFKS